MTTRETNLQTAEKNFDETKKQTEAQLRAELEEEYKKKEAAAKAKAYATSLGLQGSIVFLMIIVTACAGCENGVLFSLFIAFAKVACVIFALPWCILKENVLPWELLYLVFLGALLFLLHKKTRFLTAAKNYVFTAQNAFDTLVFFVLCVYWLLPVQNFLSSKVWTALVGKNFAELAVLFFLLNEMWGIGREYEILRAKNS